MPSSFLFFFCCCGLCLRVDWCVVFIFKNDVGAVSRFCFGCWVSTSEWQRVSFSQVSVEECVKCGHEFYRG